MKSPTIKYIKINCKFLIINCFSFFFIILEYFIAQFVSFPTCRLWSHPKLLEYSSDFFRIYTKKVNNDYFYIWINSFISLSLPSPINGWWFIINAIAVRTYLFHEWKQFYFSLTDSTDALTALKVERLEIHIERTSAGLGYEFI